MSAYYSKKYSWRSGYSYSTSAETVGKVLESIEEKNGEVTAVSFLEASRPEDSPTHQMFEWDDREAAEKYRLTQSRSIILQLEVTVSVSESPVVEVELEEASTVIHPRSAYVNIAPKGRVNNVARFVNICDALENEIMREQLLKNALSELRMFKKKYNDISELIPVFDAIRKLEEETA